MANTVTNTNNLSLRSILEKDKLTGANFLDWERNLMIVLRHERKWYVLEEPLGEAPPANATANVRNAYRKHSDDLLDVGCLMLATMSPDLQTGLMNTNAYDMIRQLRDMFQTQARTERYDATRALNACKMAKGTSVSDHVMKMKKHIDHLERLGHPVPLQLATDTILNSLTEDYKQFVINYNMNNMEKTIAELHSMLKTAELSMGTGTKTKDVLMVGDGRAKRKRGHGNTSKGKSQSQASQSVTKVDDERKGKGKKVKPNKAKTENRCFICHELGHWRRNCPKRHKEGNNASGTFYHLPGYKGAYNLVSLSACLGASLGPCHQSGIANLHNVPGLDPARGNSVWSFTGGSISSNPGLRSWFFSCQFDTRIPQNPNTFEQIYPPTFFDIMIHLVMHLPEEAIQGGPVYMRWMYLFERYMKKLKNYVRNKARPEGSIAEGYVAEEALTFCSMYLRDVLTRFNCPDRNEDAPFPTPEFHVFQLVCTPVSKSVATELNHVLWTKVEWFVLNNSLEIDEYMTEFTTVMLGNDLQTTFPNWFKKKINQLRVVDESRCSLELHALANGLTFTNTYTACIVNGVRFLVHSRDTRLTTQNSGVSTPGPEGNMYYGLLEEILELVYLSGCKVVLFRDVIEEDVIHDNNSNDLALSANLDGLTYTSLSIGEATEVEEIPTHARDDDDDFVDDADSDALDRDTFDDEIVTCTYSSEESD
ncbi:hypothetical protein OSB04_002461 [Centaurea solstitialis]|uniref:CCHC-type domain-containing protein n=1 Tax=Centaurea solstitialis TaxID=347529 RepID=A0AA38WT82_9ASTR|nr:hypothetical protein OSB04_002461 [Centaurea solstitialis]